MIRNRILNKNINKIHKGRLIIVYNDHKTDFFELLKIDESVVIDKKNLQYFLIRIYTVKKGILLPIMNEFVQSFEKTVYELRSVVHLPIRNSSTVFFSTNPQ